MKIYRDTTIDLAKEAGLRFSIFPPSYCSAVGLPEGTVCSINDVSIEAIERLCNLAVEHYVESAVEELTGLPHEMKQCPHGVDDGACKECYARDAEPVYQWRKRFPNELWHDATEEFAYQRVDEFYEARTLYTHPATDEQTVPLSEYKKLQKLVTSQGIRLMEYESGPDDTALLRQALEALEHYREQTRPIFSASVAITTLRKRLGDAG